MSLVVVECDEYVEQGRWKSAKFQHFHKTLPHGKGDFSAPQIAIDTNDGVSESWEYDLQAHVSQVVAECDEHVDQSRWKNGFGENPFWRNALF